MLTATEMITEIERMDNGERIDFLIYLHKKHFNVWRPSHEEIMVLRAYHEGMFEGIDIDEYDY